MNINKRKLAIAMAECECNFKQLATLSKVSRTTLSYINCGKSCTPEVAGKIAKALGKPVTDLIEEEPQWQKPSECPSQQNIK